MILAKYASSDYSMLPCHNCELAGRMNDSDCKATKTSSLRLSSERIRGTGQCSYRSSAVSTLEIDCRHTCIQPCCRQCPKLGSKRNQKHTYNSICGDKKLRNSLLASLIEASLQEGEFPPASMASSRICSLS